MHRRVRRAEVGRRQERVDGVVEERLLALAVLVRELRLRGAEQQPRVVRRGLREDDDPRLIGGRGSVTTGAIPTSGRLRGLLSLNETCAIASGRPNYRLRTQRLLTVWW